MSTGAGSKKIRVTHTGSRGGQHVVGLITPVVGMVTNLGTIAAIDAAGLITMGDTSVHVHGGRQRFYPHHVSITSAAAASAGWPNTGGSQKFGHRVQSAIVVTEHQGRTNLNPGGSPVTTTY